ncbi:MAG: SCO family protein [Alphaproteobacteria bacterium]|nr:SCO family protein [Alphaproteobacteria bacterium]
MRRWIPYTLLVVSFLILTYVTLDRYISDEGPMVISQTSQTSGNNSKNVKIGGPFTLVDHTGKKVTEVNYTGAYKLIFFGYTFCPDVCPTAMQTVSDVLETMGSKGEKLQPLFISIDPDRDTPEILASFLENFHPKIIGLTGSQEQIRNVSKSYRAYFAKVQEQNEESDDTYLMDHSSSIYLMGPDGEFIKIFSHGAPAQKLANELQSIL